MEKIDLTGKRFGRLIVTKEIKKRRNSLIYWECLCDCGSIAIKAGKTLKNGRTRSCGCLHSEQAIENIKNYNNDNEVQIWSKREVYGGYIEIKTPEGWAREHVYEIEKKIGRKLGKNEIVHHVDGNKKNNEISNLILMTNGEHSSFHNKNRKVSIKTRQKISSSLKKRTVQKGHIGQKLNDQDVINIKKMLNSGKLSYKEIASKYKVSKSLIASINKGRIWKYTKEQ